MVVGGRPVSPKEGRRRLLPLLRGNFLHSLPSSLLPLTVILFSVIVTASIAVWATSSTSLYSPGTSKSANAKQSTKAAGSPFLSDVLPETPGKERVRLTNEEAELTKAEAVYKNNIIRRWEMMGGSLPPHPYRGWNAGRIREVFLQPTYPCPHPQKIGSTQRGKWVCNAHKIKSKGDAIIFSVGAFEDLSFEEQAFRDFGPKTKVHVFSHYLSGREERKLMEPGSKASKFLASFHPIGLCPVDSCAQMQKDAPPGKEYLTFDQLMNKMGERKIDILKIDCEGCETNVIYEIGQNHKKEYPPFDQIIVEIHHARVPTKTLPVIFALEGLGFRLFHVEGERTSSQRYELSFVHDSFLFHNKTSSVKIYQGGNR